MQDVYDIDLTFLSSVLFKLHLFSIFHNQIKTIELNSKIDFFFKPYLYYQQTIITLLSQIIENITTQINNKFKPVILKGPAFWNNIYSSNYLRRIEDLDLLILKEKDIFTFCNIVENMGFICDDINYKDKIYNHYELPPFRKKGSCKC